MNSFLTVVVLSLIHLVNAQNNLTAQYSKTDTANDHVGWVPSSPGRSTMDIVWSCVSVLLVCTYKCVHLNISSFEENEAGWHKTKLYGFEVSYWPRWPLVRKSLRKMKWMFIVLIAPEFGVGIAVFQFIEARKELRAAKEDFPEEVENLTITHAFYSIMGGYAMAGEPTPNVSGTSKAKQKDSVGGNSQSDGEPQLNSQPLVEAKDEEHGPPLASADEVPETSWKVKHKDLWALDLSMYVRICKPLPPYPNQIATEESLYDRSKSDAFTKLFAITQSIWLVFQSIVRVSAGLPITQLELATMAYVLCAIIMYGFWWFKPFAAEHVIIVPHMQGQSLSRWRRKKQLSGDIWDHMASDFDRGGDGFLNIIMFYGVGTAFSAIHLAAWNWVFPSYAVKIIWRAFAIGATASGPLFVTLYLLDLGLEPGKGKVSKIVGIFVLAAGLMTPLVYVPSRLGLIVLIVYSFSSMPAAIYNTVDWTSYLPHFG